MTEQAPDTVVMGLSIEASGEVTRPAEQDETTEEKP